MSRLIALYGFILFGLSGCLYGDIVPYDGKLQVTTNEANQLCVMPLFNTISDDDMPDALILKEVIIRDYHLKGGETYHLTIHPKSGQYKVMNRQVICMDDNDARLSYQRFKPIEGDNLFVLLSANSENDKHHYRFSTTFSSVESGQSSNVR